MNQEDIFRNNLKTLFGDFEAPVPDNGWEKLEQSLNKAKRIHLVRRNWYIGAAAAVAALLITGVLFLDLPKSIEDTSAPLIVKLEDQNILQENNSEDVTITKEINADNDITLIKKEVLLATSIENNISDTENLFISKHLTETSADNGIIIEAENNNHTSNLEDSKKEKNEIVLSQEEIERLIMEFASAGNIDLFGEYDYPDKKQTPVMLAVNGGGGLLNSQTVANNPMTLRSTVADEYNLDGDHNLSIKNNTQLSGHSSTFNSNNAAGNSAELSHAQPVSAGITVSKNIIDRLSIETGLVYTYLYSKSKNNGAGYSNQETQNFHYLGIPLNLNYNFINIGDLGFFATLGGMIEKDIYADYRSMGESSSNELGEGSKEMMQTKKISQKHPQLSVKAGFGISYPLYKGVNLYGKLGGAYYFDAKNYEYKTIYSDKKIMLDLNAGIRFDF